MTTKTTTAPQDLAALEHLAVRHTENLEGLEKAGANFASQAAVLESEITDWTERLNHVEPSTDGGVAATYNIRKKIVELERDLGVCRFELGQIETQRTDELARADVTAKALEAARAQ